MIPAIIVLIGLFILWKLFVDGWLFKIILFIFGWVGLYACLRVYVVETHSIAFTFGGGTTVSWAAVIPSIICILALVCTKEK